jgi:hypothetical protein
LPQAISRDSRNNTPKGYDLFIAIMTNRLIDKRYPEIAASLSPEYLLLTTQLSECLRQGISATDQPGLETS